ncbi:glycosyltransferase [Embleya sp. NPDC059237]|uniref:glycosyltransferase family 2 protein n=1 Tax=Embleya sp. NPDC059237 TaxID=3346784 RepID=UPI0036A87D90
MTATARYATGYRGLRDSLAYLAAPVLLGAGEPQVDIPVHVIVPVLREQAVVGSTVRWFAELIERFPNTTLTIVTTAREDRERDALAEHIADATRAGAAITSTRFPQLSQKQAEILDAERAHRPDGVLASHQVRAVLDRNETTQRAVERLLAKPGLCRPALHHVHYRGDGRKAAQVNLAVSQIPATTPGYIAVFDVDSRPDVELWARTLQYVDHCAEIEGELPAVVQQSARFTVGDSEVVTGWEGAVCRGAARLQTLHTLRREIPDFRRYSKRVADQGTHPIGGLAQTVGHGLWIRRDVFDKVGGLPTFTLLDDLPLGYRLTVEGVPVHVVPYLATASAPGRAVDLVAQGRRWFHNYLDYPRCATAARTGGHGSATGRRVALALGLYRGGAWLLRSPAFALCLLAIANRNARTPIRVLAAGGVWFVVVAPVRLLAATEGVEPSIAARTHECLELAAALLVSSVGPAIALARDTHGRALARALSPKAERHQVPSGEGVS